MISIDKLREILGYNKTTGEVFRKDRPNRPTFRAKDGSGYHRGIVFGRSYSAHRVVWALHYGYWPEEVDHINHNRTDNRVSNLREVSRLENTKNKALSKNNTSGTCGVHWHKKDKSWQSRIKINGVNKYIGSYKSKDEAIAARKSAEADYGFHPNHGLAA